MVSSGAFWVAISYRLAACCTGIEVRVELNLLAIVPVFWELYLLPEENCRQKNDKNDPKIDKNCAKIALFLYIFCICSLKI